MALHLVTGYAGKTHITSADQGALHAAIFGRENYVLNTGNCFSAQAVTSNSVKVLDGEVIMQGRHIRLEPGAYEEVTIENGTQEYFRNDLICIRYTKDADTGIESASFVVIKGTPDASSAIDPEYNEGNILNGILTVDLPLYRVPLSGLNIGDLVPLFETKESIDKRIEAVSEDAEKLKNGTTPVGNAKKLNGLAAEKFRGNGTGFVYPWKNTGDANDIKTETHYFAFNIPNLPSSTLCGGEPYGWLDVDVFSGALFSPSGGKTVVRQTFRPWATGRILMRYYREDTDTWTEWGSGADGGNADTVDGFHASDFVLLADALASGLFSPLCNNVSVGQNISVQDLFSRNTVTFFTNWYDSTSFPSAWGSGILLPQLDATGKTIIYSQSNRLFVGKVINDGTTWTVTWDEKASTADLANYLPLTGGYMNGPLTFVHGSSGSDYEGGEFYLQKPTISKFDNNISIDVANESIRMFASHDGKTKGFLLDFDSLDGLSTVLHTGNSQAVVTSASAPSDTSALWVVPAT